jgi:hypothetical protein
VFRKDGTFVGSIVSSHVLVWMLGDDALETTADLTHALTVSIEDRICQHLKY